MADDLNKKITIEVELESEKLTQNITSLNSVIDELLAKQQKLNTGNQQNSTSFETIADKLKEVKEKLDDVNKQLTTNTTSANNLATATKALDTALASSASGHINNSKALTDSANKTKELSKQVSSLTQAAQKQVGGISNNKGSLDNYSTGVAGGATSVKEFQANIIETSAALDQSEKKLDESKSSFDAHKLTMDHLKKSFDEIKNVSGIFGPSLKEAAEGFGPMKSGLKLVQDGFSGVGTAIKADGFDFLLQILQLLFDSFVKSEQGSKILKGAISAIGVVINQVKGFFNSFLKDIINVFSHPMDSLKALGTMIEQNLINRFKAFGVILDGIMHLDFKKVANGAIQATTGVTNAIDKTTSAFSKLKKGAVDTAKKMQSAFKKGYDQDGKNVNKLTAKIIKENEEKINSYNNVCIAAGKAGKAENEANNPTRGPQLDPAKSEGMLPDESPANQQPVQDIKLQETQKTEDQVVKIKKTALQQVEDYAKQSGTKIAADALNLLNNSIKQQSEAKIASLEKEKNAELSNKSLTAAQKLAIQQKYQQQENQVKVKAFKEEQELSIIQAIINGAEAVTKVSAQSGVLAPLEIGVVVAETAAQVAKIAAQKPPAYAKGGLHYQSDGRGGVLPGYSRTDNTNAYLRSGEAIVVSEAMRNPWARNLVSAINVGFGGRDFSMPNPGRGYAVGGIFTDGGDANRYYNQPVNDQKNLANSIAYQMVNNFPPVYVDVKDINNQQNKLAQTINRVNL